jgi:hypothetical protein
MILESILPVIGHAGAVKEFVEGGALAVMLQEIGGIEVDAAILCIKNMAQSQNPLREVELAVGHLQSAHFAFQKLYQGMNFVNASFHEVRIRRTIAKVQEINVLMAICYSYLSEPVLMKESIKRAADACEWMIEKWKLRKLRVGFEVHGLSGCNPMNWYGWLMPKGPLGGNYFGGLTDKGEYCGVLWPDELQAIQAQLESLETPSQQGPVESTAQQTAPWFSFLCPSCGQEHKVIAALAGKNVKCPQSGEKVLVPVSAAQT